MTPADFALAALAFLVACVVVALGILIIGTAVQQVVTKWRNK